MSLRDALAAIHSNGADLVVVLSPHGAASGVYARASGSLSGFGVPGLPIAGRPEPRAATELAELWGKPLLSEEPDYGALVPVQLLTSLELPVVAAAVAEDADPAAQGESFATALAALAERRTVAFVASANGSPGLSARSPLTEVAGARALESELIDALERDVAEVPALAQRLGSEAGSCSAAPLTALGRLFGGRPASILAYSDVFGVGYAVAVVDGPERR